MGPIFSIWYVHGEEGIILAFRIFAFSTFITSLEFVAKQFAGITLPTRWCWFGKNQYIQTLFCTRLYISMPMIQIFYIAKPHNMNSEWWICKLQHSSTKAIVSKQLWNTYISSPYSFVFQVKFFFLIMAGDEEGWWPSKFWFFHLNMRQG